MSLGQVSEREQCYATGDFVWANNNAGAGGIPWLAHIESGHSIRTHVGRRWLVRVRRRSGWTSGAIHMFITGPLTAEQLAHNRRLGLIPPEGERV